ncbi:MAG: 16S rRNA (cytosine(1402)-N(4))-methyltransferase RsmH [Actinobacteria bacterium]|nr:16S rRNA (cytosine(1402)-N(4))-methyltransferase RsmH [Actinomycetota bacterium]
MDTSDATPEPIPEATPENPFRHLPVMLDEVLAALEPMPAGAFLDATVGGGGHAAALLDARPDCRLIGIDRDAEAIEAAGHRLAAFGERVHLVHAAFRDLSGVLAHVLGGDPLVGFLFDLGVSSPQLDRSERGFSYREPGPLDMRMDRRQTRTAADLVNGSTESELAAILRTHADERHAGRIAAALVAARPVTDTRQLADLVRDAIPAPARRRGGHPAKRTFQALRIAVNDELAQLPGTLDMAIERLVTGGRGVVLAYHSGEDRIVKERFDQAATGGCTCPARLPCGCGAVSTARTLRRGARLPSDAEQARNPRAASARLRVLERTNPEKRP